MYQHIDSQKQRIGLKNVIFVKVKFVSLKMKHVFLKQIHTSDSEGDVL